MLGSKDSYRHKINEKSLPTVTIEGEEFTVEQEHENVYVSHPRWSLTGMGENLAQAVVDVRVTARIIYDTY